MIAAALRFAFRRFGRRYDYDPAYLIDIVDAETMAGLQLGVASAFLSQDFGLPPPVYFAAKARSTRRADCGSCLRLVIDMAAEKGVTADELLPIFGKGHAAPEISLAIAFVDAALDNSPELLELGAEVERQFGKTGRIGLATAVVAGQFYPTLKRAMGHANACEPVLNDFLAKTGRDHESQAGRHD